MKEPDPGAHPSSTGPVVHRSWFNVTADAAQGRLAFLANGLQGPTAAGVFLSLDENVTWLVVEVRWDDPTDGVSLAASWLDPNCQGFPPSLGDGCAGHYLRSYVGDEGYWRLRGDPLSTTSLRLELGPDDLAGRVPADWEFFGAVEDVGVDVRIELVVSVFRDQDLPDGYSAWPPAA